MPVILRMKLLDLTFGTKALGNSKDDNPKLIHNDGWELSEGQGRTKTKIPHVSGV